MCGYYVYKDNCVPHIGMDQLCKPDTREEALSYEMFAISVFVRCDGCDKLGGSYLHGN